MLQEPPFLDLVPVPLRPPLFSHLYAPYYHSKNVHKQASRSVSSFSFSQIFLTRLEGGGGNALSLALSRSRSLALSPPFPSLSISLLQPSLQMPGFALTLAPMIAVFYAPPDQAAADVSKWSLVFFGIGLGCLVAATVRQAGLGRAGSRLTRQLRERLLESALKQEIAWFDAPENASGALSARLSADTARVRGSAGDALGVAAQAATGLGGGGLSSPSRPGGGWRS